GRAVGEREDADVLLRNDVDGGRGSEEEGAAVGELVVAQSIFSDIPAQAVVLIARARVRLRRVGSDAADLRLVSFGEGVRIDELLAIPLSSIELQANPLCEIASTGTDSAGGRLGVGLVHEAIEGLPID